MVFSISIFLFIAALMLLFFTTNILYNFCSFSGMLDFSFSISLYELLFSLSLTLIFFCIMLYSFFYFSFGADFLRFFILLSFFFSMFILIHHKNILTLFIGWDGLGVTSYLLVCYYMNWKSMNGAMTTVMTNRFGDTCLFFFYMFLFGQGMS